MFHRILSALFLKRYLEQDETILFIAHKHPVILFWDAIQVAILGILVPLGLIFSNPDLYTAAIIIGAVFWVRFFYQFLLWFFDCWVFTNKGVTDIRWINLFNRQTINVGYRHCEGMTVRIQGFIHTILRMGDMTLDRDAQSSAMILTDAYRPHRIEERFLAAKAAARGAGGANESSDKVKYILSEMINEYAANKGISLED